MASTRKKEKRKSFQKHLEDFIRVLPRFEKYAQVLEKVFLQARNSVMTLSCGDLKTFAFSRGVVEGKTNVRYQ